MGSKKKRGNPLARVDPDFLQEAKSRGYTTSAFSKKALEAVKIDEEFEEIKSYKKKGLFKL